MDALYTNDEVNQHPILDAVVTGRQWYWDYQYGNVYRKEIIFESRITERFDVDSEKMVMGRGFAECYEVDNPLVLPCGGLTRLLITRADVIHRFFINGGGIKADAIPGRLNRCCFQPVIPGILFGACAELCGEHHSHMPIIVEVVEGEAFKEWLDELCGVFVSDALKPRAPKVEELPKPSASAGVELPSDKDKDLVEVPVLGGVE